MTDVMSMAIAFRVIKEKITLVQRITFVHPVVVSYCCCRWEWAEFPSTATQKSDTVDDVTSKRRQHWFTHVVSRACMQTREAHTSRPDHSSSHHVISCLATIPSRDQTWKSYVCMCFVKMVASEKFLYEKFEWIDTCWAQHHCQEGMNKKYVLMALICWSDSNCSMKRMNTKGATERQRL